MTFICQINSFLKMKNLLLKLFACFLFCAIGNKSLAQSHSFEKDDVFIDFIGTYNVLETRLPGFNDVPELMNTNARGYTVFVSANAGFFVSKKFAAGLGFGMGKDYFNDPPGNYVLKGSSYAYRGFLRYYPFNNLGDFQIYAELAPEFRSGSQRLEYHNSSSRQDSRYFIIGLNVGFSYFFNNEWAVSAILVNNATYENHFEGNKERNGFHGNLNIFRTFIDNPTFGIMFLF